MLSHPLYNKYRLLEAEYQTGIYIRRVIGVAAFQHQAEVVSEEELGTAEGTEAEAQVVLPMMERRIIMVFLIIFCYCTVNV